MANADQLGAVAAELYALPLDQFTTARNDRAADARAAGDRELADRIKQLKKPSASAWAVNMLSRHRADEVSQLLDLGAALRQAQTVLDADDLRELGMQRQKLIAAIVRQARSVAADLGGAIGPAVADEVGQTLQAALADPDAAEAVTAGLLTRALTPSGWGPIDVDGSVAVPSSTGRTAQVTEISARQIAKAERRLEAAEELLRKRETEARKLAEKLQELEPRRDGLISELEELEARTAELRQELATVDRERDSLARQQEKASAAVDDAGLDVDEASAELKRLT